MPTATQTQSTTLYYRSGGSDKVYQVAIEPSGPGFAVNFAFGRRGSTLQAGSKTAQPVGFDEAVKIYEKLVREKTAKGYTPGEDGTPYQQTEKADRATGVLPQLLNAIDEKDVERYLTDSGWWAQEKFDGRRVLIRRSGDEISGINRQGLVIPLPETLTIAAARIRSQHWIIDGEALGDTYFAFDVLASACLELKDESYADRQKELAHILPPDGPIQLVPTAKTTHAKRQLLADLHARRAEGIVFKRHTAVYTPGRPNSGGDQLKYKFVCTASCIVAGVNGSKRSVRLELNDGEKRIGVGSVTIPANHSVPIAGQIVEIRYLYAFVGGSLFQPVYLGVRDDLCAAECKVSQLKFKPDGPDTDADNDARA